MRPLSIVSLSALALTCTIGCSDDSGDEAKTVSVPLCVLDFSVDVTAGPSSPMSLAGQLQLAVEPGGDELEGELIPTGVAVSDAAGHIPVTGSYTASTITLEFETPTGMIVGTGPWNGQCAKGVELTGMASGPKAGDSGDWLGGILYECTYGTELTCAAAIGLEFGKRACFAACSYGGYSDAKCNSTCATNN